METGINECDFLQKEMCEVENDKKLACYKSVVVHTHIHKFLKTKKPTSHFLQDSSLFSCILNSMALCYYTRSALGYIPEITFLGHLIFAILARGQLIVLTTSYSHEVEIKCHH